MGQQFTDHMPIKCQFDCSMPKTLSNNLYISIHAVSPQRQLLILALLSFIPASYFRTNKCMFDMNYIKANTIGTSFL